jgi:hypothetical protein
MADFRNVIAFVRNRHVSTLVTPRAFAKLEALADWLPDAMSSYYLECRLTGDHDQVDLMGCIRAWDGGRQNLKDHLLQNRQYRGRRIWESVSDLCVDWSARRSSTHELIPHLWLSFDLDDHSWLNPAPCLLMCLDQSRFPDGRDQRSSMLTARELRLLSDSIFETLLGRPTTKEERATIESCRDSLLPGEQLAHMSVMLSREPIAQKIDISMPTAGVHRYLERVNWTGSLQTLDKLISRLCPEYERVGFQLVIGESLAPTIELELHFDNSNESRERYCVLVDRLSDAGLCAKEYEDDLKRWPGQFRLPSPGNKWPTRWRTWMDVKIVQARNCSVAAKAYLGLAPSTSLF